MAETESVDNSAPTSAVILRPILAKDKRDQHFDLSYHRVGEGGALA